MGIKNTEFISKVVVFFYFAFLPFMMIAEQMYISKFYKKRKVYNISILKSITFFGAGI